MKIIIATVAVLSLLVISNIATGATVPCIPVSGMTSA